MSKSASEGSPSGDEAALLARLRTGEPDAFAALVDRWLGELLRFLRLLGADAQEAEDVVQETFLKIFNTRRRYRELAGGSFRPLLMRVARNGWLDLVRRRQRRPRTVALEAAAGVASPRPDAARGGGTDDRLDLLESLARIGQKHREVVVLNVFHGLDYAEVAATLGIPVGTVKSRMHYALSALKEVLDGR